MAEFKENIFEGSQAYFYRVDGCAPNSNTGKREILDVPKKIGPRYKKIAALLFQELGGNQTPIGYVDLHINHPKEGYAYMGLLILKESLHGQGLGRKTYDLVENYLKQKNGVKRIILGVSDKNKAQQFWEKTV